MSTPSSPDLPSNEVPSAELRQPSYPDRARIDSDVRAFLKPASSPWIVFNRASKVDDFATSALRIGAFFASRPDFRPSVLDAASGADPAQASSEADLLRQSRASTPVVISESPPFPAPLFPPSTTPHEPVAEPSGLSVAADLQPDTESQSGNPRASIVDAFRPRWGRAVAVAASACAIGFVATLGVWASTRHVARDATRAEVRAPAVAVAVAAPVVEAPVAPPAPVETVTSAAKAYAPEVAPTTPVTADSAKTGKKRFGRLTLKADAAKKSVWFDGLRMLGTGTRSFTVLCGMHTVAVTDKTDSKDIEVPCSGEYVVK